MQLASVYFIKLVIVKRANGLNFYTAFILAVQSEQSLVDFDFQNIIDNNIQMAKK